MNAILIEPKSQSELNFIAEFLKRINVKFKEQPIYQKATIKAMNDAKNGRVVKFKSIDDMIKSNSK